MTSNISFAVICPTLKASPETILRLVHSLEAQSHVRWRLLFVNGNSPYSKQTIYLNWLSSTFPRVIVNQERGTPSIYSAMNYGYSLSHNSHWSMFWGSDDYCSTPDALSQLAYYIEKNSITTPIFNSARFVSPSGVYLRDVIFPSCVNPSLSSILGFSPPHQGVVLPPNFSFTSPIYQTKYQVAADLHFFLNIVRNTKVVVNNSLCLASVQSGGFSSRNYWRKYYEVLVIYYSHYGFLGAFPFLLRYLYKGIYSLTLTFLPIFN